MVTLWVRDSHAHLDGELYSAVKSWVSGVHWEAAGWGSSVAWPGRVESFDEWDVSTQAI